MKKIFTSITTFGLALAFLPQASADPWDQRSVITVHQAIQVPGAILEPGKYVMKLYGSNVSRNIVQISTEAGNEVVATLLTIPSYRQTVSARTDFSFREIVEGQPKPLHTWFYPGNMIGHEFVYTDGFLSTGVKSAQAGSADAGKLDDLAVYAKAKPNHDAAVQAAN